MLKISRAALAKVVEDARARYPQEAVGILGGVEPGIASYSIALTNRGNEKSFFADPIEQFRAEKQLRARQHHFVATYHSHPDGCAHLSEEDKFWLRSRPEYQVLIAFRQDVEGHTLAVYAPKDGELVEIPWSVVEES